MRINRDNWFLVLPTVVLGIVATYTLYQLHAAGDVRRAIEVVAEYAAEGEETLGDFLAQRGPVVCDATVVSSFYGTMDVTCTVGRLDPERYVWRVDVMQQAFAPADEPTRRLMAEYQPSLFAKGSEQLWAPAAASSRSSSTTA